MVRTEDPAAMRWRRRATCALASTALIAGGAAVLAGPAAAAPGDLVYVSSDGADHSGCGASPSNQCATIQYGIGQVSAGGTVQVAAGTYYGVVTIDKALTLEGAGASTTAIDGLNQPAGTNGLVDIAQPGGDVTVDGFTITNPTLGSGYSPYSLTIGDSNAADTITVSNNVFPGDPASPSDAAAAPIGVDSADTAATQVITDNEFSGLFQGVLVEGSRGPTTVSDNVFHDLIATSDGNGGSYPAEGVYFLSDKEVTAGEQNTTGNTFRDYGGIGIAYSAGYDLGGCAAPAVCTGTVSGAITGNTFQLDPNQGTYEAAALRLRAKYAGDALNLTVGNNTGVVSAPTQPVIEEPNAGTISITPTATPNTISTDPASTISIDTPTSITTAEPAQTFTGTATNPSAENLTNVRYDITIKGTSGITASQVKLQYDAGDGSGFHTVPLTGTARAGDAITGYFGPVGGFTFPAGATLSTNFTVSVPGVSAPAGVLTSTVSLDQVSSGTGHPVLNTLASSSASTTIVDNSAPVATGSMVTTSLNTAVPITLTATDADNDGLLYSHTTPAHGTLTGSGANLTYTPDTDYVGSDAFAFTVTDNKGGSDTATVTIVVGKATSALTVTVSPTPTTTGTVPTVTVAVTRTPGFGTVNGGTVTLFGTSADGSTFGYRKTVAGGQATFTLPLQAAGTTQLTASFSGTSTTTSVDTDTTFTVAKVTPRFTYVTSPTTVKASTSAKSKVVVTIVSDGAPTTGAVGTLTFGTKVVSTATAVGGKITVTLPALSAGKHNLTFTYKGNAATNASTKLITLTVAKG